MRSEFKEHIPSGSLKDSGVELNGENIICIRGRSFNLYELVNPALYDAAHQEVWAAQLKAAIPYPHLSVAEWFNPDFLNLILEEFELNKSNDWRVAKNSYVDFRRSIMGEYLGPATELYFSIINSSWFVRLLSKISNIPNLIVDHERYGGGMHETVSGGHFSIHSDFNRHVKNGLSNKMVFITYLTPDWQPEWAGDLELWDADSKQCITKVAPTFGQSVLMLNGKGHYHGHPSIWNAPKGITRRSVANYYYVNEFAKFDSSEHYDSIYISPSRYDRAVGYVRPFLPPVVWNALRKMMRRP